MRALPLILLLAPLASAQMAISPFAPPGATSDPGTCYVGQIYVNTATATFKQCSATNTWVNFVTGPASSTSGNVPVWNGTGGKALAAGLPVATSATASALVETGAGGIIDSSFLPASTVIGAKAYGTVCDGSTDDTAHIQAAIDAVPTSSTNNNPTVVQLPSGRCIVSGVIQLRRNGMTLQGYPGWGYNGGGTNGYSASTYAGGTQLVAASTFNGPVLRIDPLDILNATAFASSNVRGTSFRDLSIDVSAAVGAGYFQRHTATASSSGATVTRSSGNSFTSDMVGSTIRMGTYEFIVKTYNSASSITLMSAPAASFTSQSVSWCQPVVAIRSLSRAPTFENIYIYGFLDTAILESESFLLTETTLNPYPSEHIHFYNLQLLSYPSGQVTAPGFVVEGGNQTYLDSSNIAAQTLGTLNATRNLDVAAIEIRATNYGLLSGGVYITNTVTAGYAVHYRIRGADYTVGGTNGGTGNCSVAPVNGGGCAVTASHVMPSQVVIVGAFGEGFNRGLVMGDETTTLAISGFPGYGIHFDSTNHFISAFDGTGSPFTSGPGSGSTTPVYRAYVNYAYGGQVDQVYEGWWHQLTLGSATAGIYSRLIYDPNLGQTQLYALNGGSNNFTLSTLQIPFSSIPSNTNMLGKGFGGMSLLCYDCGCSSRLPITAGGGEWISYSSYESAWLCGN